MRTSRKQHRVETDPKSLQIFELLETEYKIIRFNTFKEISQNENVIKEVTTKKKNQI